MLHLKGHIHHLTQYLHHHPGVALIATLIISFVESLPLLGSFIPGSVTMTAIGTLIGANIIPIAPTLLCAIIGAFSGDYISYVLGRRYKDHWRVSWPFKKHQKWLKNGEAFIERHGIKSVVIGRFVGPMRSLLPFIVGMLNMQQWRFTIAAIFSAIGWAIVYTLPGIIIGALSLELPAHEATEFLIEGILWLVFIWLLIWLLQKSYQQCVIKINNKLAELWKNITHTLPNCAKWISNSTDPTDHGSLTLLLWCSVLIVIFLFIWVSVLTHSGITSIDAPIQYFSQTLRTPTLDRIAITITLLAYYQPAIFASFLLFVYLLIRKYYWDAFHFFAAIFIASGAVYVFKEFTPSVRPDTLTAAYLSSSFPSGHTTMSVALYGFLSMLISIKLNRQWRQVPYIIAVLIILCVGITRIYLGAHWPTDILAAFCLGSTVAMVVTVNYRRRKLTKLHANELIVVSVLCLFVGWVGMMYIGFEKNLHKYTPFVHYHSISYDEWWKQTPKTQEIPLARSNRVGHPVQVLNVQWLGNIDNIATYLTKEGWDKHTLKHTFKSRISELANTSKLRLPLLKQLYHDKPPVLVMTLHPTKGAAPIVLRLWDSFIHIDLTDKPLWIGTIDYPLPKHHIFAHHHRSHAQEKNPLDVFIKYLHKPYKWKTITLTTNQLPPHLRKAAGTIRRVIIQK